MPPRNSMSLFVFWDISSRSFALLAVVRLLALTSSFAATNVTTKPTTWSKIRDTVNASWDVVTPLVTYVKIP